jgi:hypothetical protein
MNKEEAFEDGQGPYRAVEPMIMMMMMFVLKSCGNAPITFAMLVCPSVRLIACNNSTNA